MKGFLKAMMGIGIVAVLVLIVIFSSGKDKDRSSLETPSASPSSTASDASSSGSIQVADPYDPNSTNVLDPNDLVKNPYKLKGRSGILDTVQTPIIAENGARMGFVPYPGGCMKFSKMLDEHTAVYEVMALEDGTIQSEGELAVILKDSNEPASAQPWRVFVDGPMDAVNGLGQTIAVTAVRFEGYYIPPPKPAEASPAPVTTNPDDSTQPPENSTPQDQPAPAPPPQPQPNL